MASDKIHNFDIDQGATWNRSIIYKYNGVLQNLTGFTARMWLKRSITDATGDRFAQHLSGTGAWH